MPEFGTPRLRSGMSDREVRTAYRLAAPFHDWAARLLESRARRRFLEVLSVTDGDRVIEMGVGTGLTFEGLLRRNSSGWTVGVDLTPAMLERARRRARSTGVPDDHYRLLERDVRCIALQDPDLEEPTDAGCTGVRAGQGGDERGGRRTPSRPFDLLVSSYVLDLMAWQEIPQILEGWRGLLHEERGKLGLLYLAPSRRWFEQGWALLPRLHRWTLGGCRGIDPREAAREAGFRIEHHERIVQLTYPSEMIVCSV